MIALVVEINEKQNRKSTEDKEIVESTTLSDDNNSYWYVVVDVKNKGINISTVVKQNHKHFSLIEAKEVFNGNVFIVNFIQVSKETYEEQQ